MTAEGTLGVDPSRAHAQPASVPTRRKRQRPSSDDILAAAEREFAERGYADTSLRQLMAAARVSTTAFYARFATKEEVLRQLLAALLEELNGRAREELAESSSVEDGFRRGVDVLVTVLGPRRALVRIALTDGSATAPVAHTLGQLYASLAALLASRLEALTREGKIDAADPEALAWSLVGALSLQVTRWAVLGQLTTEQLGPELHRVAESILPAILPGR